MDLKFIVHFIKKNSTSNSRAKANYVDSKLISNSNDFFEFSCIGSSPEPYTITIELGKNNIKTTSCTCPYDYGGICKHTIASLEKLKEDIASGEILLLQGEVSSLQGKLLNFQPKIEDPNKLKESQILLNNAII